LISKNQDIEVIMHSWAPELEQELRREFAPVTAAFESNPGSEYFKNASWPGCKDVQGGCPWIAVSWAYSMKRSIELMRQREAETGVQFSNVVFYRPDVLLFKDIIISDILTDRRTVYTTTWGDSRCGDFHHIMARDVAIEFTRLYDVVTTGSKSCSVGCVDGHLDRQCFKRRYLEGVGIPTSDSHIHVPGDEDVYRSWFQGGDCKATNHFEELKEFGFTRNDYETVKRDGHKDADACPPDTLPPCSCSRMPFDA
jgi:hypothetical protein